MVQKALTERYRLYSLPETDFFGLSVGGGIGALTCHLGISRPRRVYHRAFERLKTLLPDDPALTEAVGSWRFRALVEQFTAVLDRQTRNTGEYGWLEKTPKHFRHTNLIARFVPQAKIIHVVRPGPDVVASIHDRAMRYPEQFGRQQDIGYAINLWNRAIRTAHNDIMGQRALILRYEDFVESPEVYLKRLGMLLGVPERTAKQDTSPVILSSEPWKLGSKASIHRVPSKFNDVFDPETRRVILAKLDIRAYESLAGHALNATPHVHEAK
ncbi:MAG: sulfotransferase [Gammaproteobacteria bacterium]|nr:sulfotransferase [Gammaproteobacteria bacterium]